MISSTKIQVQFIVKQSVALGLKYVVCSPGSRNAPLLIAFNQHPEIECIIIPDERCAAFYALGIAQQTDALVGVCCTSGSAALNYYPAIAEAYYQQTPLLVFTADRPISWVDQGDGQTIVQHEVFKNHIRFSTTITENTWDKEQQWFVNRQISEAFHAANGTVKGPVHFNLPFSEPLYDQVEINESVFIEPIQISTLNHSLSDQQLKQIQQTWEKSPKKMILCGQMGPNEALENSLKFISEDPSVIILVENTSNLVHLQFVHCIDRTLQGIKETELADFAPDLLVILGGAVVSKKIKSYLRKFTPKETWKVGHDFLFMDTYQSLVHSFPMDPFTFIKSIDLTTSNYDANYRNKWKQKDYINKDKALAFISQQTVFSDLVATNLVLDYIPENSNLHLANSSIVRYAQLEDPIKTIHTFCNRGTSGIDGSTSTACGASFVTPNKCNTLITGDISFFYDSNAFFNKLSLSNFRIFLINNDGGGIFKIIPGPNTTNELNDFFVFEHGYSAEYICKAFGVKYYSAKSISDIEQQMEEFYTITSSDKPSLMEIFTDSELNDKILKHYFDALS